MSSPPQPGGAADLATLLAETRRLCPAVRAAVLAGPDGLVVDRFQASEADVPEAELLAAEALRAIDRMGLFARAAELGSGEEWSLRTDRTVVVGRLVPGTDLWLLLLADPRDWHGRLRFAARVTTGRLEPVLADPSPES